jgi:hypothetical protein
MRGAVSLFTIPKVIEVVHHPEARAVVAHWESLCTPERRGAIERAADECKRVGAKTWVADLTRNPGVPSQEDLVWMATGAVTLARKCGLVAMINVHGESALATLGSKRWTKGASDGGLSTYDCKSLTDALQLAADIAAGRAA